MNIPQLVFRPTHSLYRTSRSGLYLCRASTPPGGGVDFMQLRWPSQTQTFDSISWWSFRLSHIFVSCANVGETSLPLRSSHHVSTQRISQRSRVEITQVHKTVAVTSSTLYPL
jgi:hypothetical protein